MFQCNLYTCIYFYSYICTHIYIYVCIYVCFIYMYLKYRILSVREIKQRNVVASHEWTEVPGIIVSTRSKILFPMCFIAQETEVA